MDSLEANKIFGAVLGTIFVVFGGSLLADGLFHSEAPEKPGYAIVAAEAPAAGGGAAAAAEDPPVATLMVSANAETGATEFKKCQACHSGEKGGPNKVGPDLWDIVNRPVAVHEGFSYSAGMKDFAKGGETKWDYDHLYHFLKGPKQYVAGTAMGFAGIKDPQGRADLLAYLRTLSDSPAAAARADGRRRAGRRQRRCRAGRDRAGRCTGRSRLRRRRADAGLRPDAGQHARHAGAPRRRPPPPAAAAPAAPAAAGSPAAPAPARLRRRTGTRPRLRPHRPPLPPPLPQQQGAATPAAPRRDAGRQRRRRQGRRAGLQEVPGLPCGRPERGQQDRPRAERHLRRGASPRSKATPSRPRSRPMPARTRPGTTPR